MNGFDEEVLTWLCHKVQNMTLAVGTGWGSPTHATRARNLLVEAGYTHGIDLCMTTDATLLCIPGFGRKMLQGVRAWMRKHGLGNSSGYFQEHDPLIIEARRRIAEAAND